MKPLLSALSFAALLAVVSTGHAQQYRTNEIRTDRYGTYETGQVRQAVEGVVVAVRQVSVRRDNTTTGGVLGAVAGGVAGSQVAKGKDRAAGVAIGALLGAIVGSRTERAATVREGAELVVRTRSGRLISVTQGADSALRCGDTVYVIYEPRGRTRVVRG